MFLVVLSLLADLTAAPSTPPRIAAAPDRVTIHVTQSGWGFKQQSLDIRHTDGGFTDGTRSIPEPLLRALVAAATAPPAARLDVARLHVDVTALRRAAEKYAANLPPKVAARFVERVCDPKNLPDLGASLVQSGWTDDDPRVEVDITLRGGEHVLLRTTAQGPLMLPWQVVRDNRGDDSYDPELARAVAALLPPKFLNGSRIGGEYVPDELVRIAEGHWHAEIERTSADEKYGAELARLRARFQVTREHVGMMMGFNANDEVWNGNVATSDPRVSFDLWLTATKDYFASTEPFLRDADALSRRVRAVPWIAHLLQSYPKATLSIQYRNDRSLGAYAQTQILEDLQRANKAALATAVASLLDRSVGVYIHEQNRWAIWIVLPDNRSFMTFGMAPMPSGMPLERMGELVTADGVPAPSP
jgi:hypothetical protein